MKKNENLHYLLAHLLGNIAVEQFPHIEKKITGLRFDQMLMAINEELGTNIEVPVEGQTYRPTDMAYNFCVQIYRKKNAH